MKRENPQISDEMLKPLLSFKKIKKGTHIHKKNDQVAVHWQLTTYIIKGIDNEHQALICSDLGGKPVAVPFVDLPAYYVNVHHNYKTNVKRIPV